MPFFVTPGIEWADGHYVGIDTPIALDAEVMASRLTKEILPAKFGDPFNIRIPIRLGFKTPKFVTAIYLAPVHSRGYRTDGGYTSLSST
jgi:DMSO/TMAO reductase YedYZ molybdopterin-dependent catalytic subunit